MLNGYEIPEADVTIEKLKILDNSKFEFHLTGSRYFDTADENSDYDFFTQSSEAVVAFLEREGFVWHQATKYTEQVYRWGMIDIQLVTDVMHKKRVQHLLSLTGALNGATKSQARFIWTKYSSIVQIITSPLSDLWDIN